VFANKKKLGDQNFLVICTTTYGVLTKKNKTPLKSLEHRLSNFLEWGTLP
jgi:hypothetical protein